MAAIHICAGTSGAQLNPALTIMLTIFRGLSWRTCLYNIAGQLIGSVLGSAFAYGLHYVAIQEHFGSKFSDAAPAFWTVPKEGVGAATAFFNELLATALLTMVVFALADPRALPPPPGVQPLITSFITIMLQVSFGSNTGPCLNPARDLGPRLVTAAAGMGTLPFSVAGWWWMWGPWVGTIVGALVGALTYDVFIGGSVAWRGGARQHKS